MFRLVMFFGRQSLACRATLATCEEIAAVFNPDAYTIEPSPGLQGRVPSFLEIPQTIERTINHAERPHF